MHQNLTLYKRAAVI